MFMKNILIGFNIDDTADVKTAEFLARRALSDKDVLLNLQRNYFSFIIISVGFAIDDADFLSVVDCLY